MSADFSSSSSVAPIAATRPHVWDRPTGSADDPYAWLRDREDAETIAYLEAENAYSAAYFEARSDLVTTVFEEIKSRVQETDVSVPVLDSGWWYVTRTIEGESYPVFSRSRDRDSLDSDSAVILDCNVEAVGHDFFSIGATETSTDHNLLAWSSDVDGSEMYTLRVRDLATGNELADELADTSAWGGVAWAKPIVHEDGTVEQWLFYARPDDQMRPHEIWRHRLGTPVADDVLVMAEPDERFYLGVGTSRSGNFVLIAAQSKQSSEAYVIPADRPTETPRSVRVREADVEYGMDDWGDRFVVLTNLDAPDFRVMTAPHDDPSTWTELIGHHAGRRLLDIEPFADHLAVHEWADAQQRLRVVSRDGTASALDFGDEPHELELGANPEWNASTLRVSYQSLTTPVTHYDVDVATGERTLLKQTPTPNVDLTKYVSVRAWAPSHDGTLVPLDIVHHVDTPLDGTAPGTVYAYGSYEASMAPWFSVARLSLLDRGAVWALAHPRGGGELGRSWYLDGKLENKRNTFLDVLACADHLAAESFVDGSRIAVRGGSAGGLMVGACVTMRPDRFVSAVAEVPFVDVVSTMSDPSLPLTVTEWEEWGDPRSEPAASFMLDYSPYDNTVAIDPARWPAIYVTAGLNDPRVSFHEPAKWTARLRASGAGQVRPLLLHTEMGAGHAGPSGRYDAWRDEARTLTFLLSTL